MTTRCFPSRRHERSAGPAAWRAVALSALLLLAGCGADRSASDGTDDRKSDDRPSFARTLVAENAFKVQPGGIACGFDGCSVDNASGTGVGGGDGASGASADAGVGVGVGESAVRNASVVVYTPDGTVLGSAPLQGSMVSIYPGSFRGPLLLKLVDTGGGQYWDESTRQWTSLQGVTLHAMLPSLTHHVSINPLTEAAYQYALARVRGEPALTAAAMQQANDAVLAQVNAKLASTYQTSDITNFATLLDDTTGTDTIPNTWAGRFAALLAAMPIAGKQFNGTLTAPALDYGRHLAADMLDDGLLNASVSVERPAYGSNSAAALSGAIVTSVSTWGTPQLRTSTLQSLAVAIAGSGRGSVFPSPEGASCGTNCYTYPQGTRVLLSASPSTGSVFTGWSGAGCSGTGTCSVSMDAARSVTATFESNRVTLSVSYAGSGSGTVAPSPAGSSCGTGCWGYAPGTAVRLTATAAAGSAFTGWSGACSGTAPTCDLSLKTDAVATVTFAAAVQLVVQTSGSGTVVSDPPGISCGTTCSAYFPFGTQVTLTATPTGTGGVFSGWGGACQGTARTCSVTTNLFTTVNASFLQALRLSGSVSGLGAASLVLASGTGYTLQVNPSATSFSFGPILPPGTAYNVTVQTQPPGYFCSVSNASGIAFSADVTNVAVTCTTGAATGDWTWKSGGNSSASAGALYGALGVAGASNVPGGRFGAASWIDTGGSLWLFGGNGFDATGAVNYLNDLWKFNPGTGFWTWVGGSNTGGAAGVYGSPGVPSASNTPGARGYPMTWRDVAGNFWLFGGLRGAATVYNDLWRYAPGAGTWTWVGGSNAANAASVYGTKGQPATGNQPGARMGGVSWIDASGNLWMFGGYAAGAFFNDLWRYAPGSGVWTWMSGSSSGNSGGTYGTPGVASAANAPGARMQAVSWVDATGKLWLFGGYGVPSPGTFAPLNDLWRYDPATGLWAWMGGSNTAAATGVYGTRGTASAGNVPGARYQAVAWADPYGDLWLHGGQGIDGSGVSGQLNDLWRYRPSAGTWAWMSGSSGAGAAGVYGSKGVASAANAPGARAAGSGWTDASGNLWLFGGTSDVSGGKLNDLWKYTNPTQPQLQ